MSEQIGKNFAGNMVVGTLVAGPAVGNWFSRVFGGLFRIAFWIVKQSARMLYLVAFAVFAKYNSRKVAKFADVVGADVQRLANEAERISLSIGGVAKGPLADLRFRGASYTPKALRKIALDSVIDTAGGRLNNDIGWDLVETLHPAFDEMERQANLVGSAEGTRLIDSIKRTRDQMVASAYSILSADVAREGERSPRLRAVIRNLLIALTIGGALIWWWTHR